MSTSNNILTEVKNHRKRNANPTPAVLRVDLAKAKQLYQKRLANIRVETNNYPEEEHLHCWIDTGYIQNGYPSISYDRNSAKIQVSHLALLVEKNETPYRSNRETASHLCHRKECIRASHIIVESVGMFY